MMGKLRIYSLLLIATLAMTSSALADQRLEFIWGHQTTRCTYLSPLTYSGPGYGLSYEWRHPAWRDKTVGMQARADFNYGYLLSPAKNSRMLDLTFDLEWGVERLWTTTSGFNFAGGATLGVDGGVIYLSRNGNNPAQALMWAGASLTGSVEYTKIKLLGKKLSISESIEIPTLGCFFCPAYGETYYEIYVGNHSGLAHFGWWGNRPNVKSRLRADWKLGKRALTLGFDYRFQGLECNDITTRIAQCSAIIGIRF
ncbi:MAG: DUF3316 domain-containing protein [Muribaculaceae bacterium]|nr:DUF3316 domain-containing protein [Muribaculaceae bacterium]